MKRCLIALALVLFGCESSTRVEVITQDEYNKREAAKLHSHLVPKAYGIKIVEFDGCEYLEYNSAYGAAEITHKGNCKYCEARRNGPSKSERP